MAKCQWNDTAGTAIEAVKSAPEELRRQSDLRVTSTPEASESSSSSQGSIPYALVAGLAVLGAAETAYLTQVRGADRMNCHVMTVDGVIVNISAIQAIIVLDRYQRTHPKDEEYS